MNFSFFTIVKEKYRYYTLKKKYNSICVITFAKGNFITSAELLGASLLKQGITNFKILKDEDLGENFKLNNKSILEMKKGYGYCIWKPFIILNELINLKANKILLYIDSTDLPSSLFFNYLISYFKSNSLLLCNRGYKHREWTKRDCFVFMDCDSEKYHSAVQLEAGLLAFKKTPFNIKLIEQWNYFVNNKNILTEIPNISELPNLDGFVEHRYDQSILTNLAIYHGVNSQNLDERYVKYNYNQPSIYG